MDEQRVFVGRQAELNRFLEILEDPRGQAIVVVGQAGMGKTWLIDKITELATQHPRLKCGWVRCEVAPTESADATLERMMDNAFGAPRTSESSFDVTDRLQAQWLGLLRTLVLNGGDVAGLVISLRRDPRRHTREQFLDRLRLISTGLGPDGRVLFVIDPEKHMCPGCADSWRLVARELPEKVKFLFAQQPDDELVNSSSFMALDNVIRLPGESLGVLAAEEVDDLVRRRAGDVGQPVSTLQDAVNGYQGHPYAIQAALEIVRRTKQVEDLPQDPTPQAIIAAQWQQVCDTGDDAVRLFEAHASLEVAVPRDVVQGVTGFNAVAMMRLLSDSYLSGLLCEEGRGTRIYHAILADHVRSQIDQIQQRTLHARAADVYRASLKTAEEEQSAPDALAVVRLPEHVLAAEGPGAFVATFISECTRPLRSLGLLDAAMSLAQRSLSFVERSSIEEAAVLGHLGVIYWTRGDLDEAEKMCNSALEINQRLGRLEGMASDYRNLGVIHQMRGDLAFDRAEQMHTKALEIDQHLGRFERVANDYSHLAGIYQTRGDLDRAEQMLKKALEIDQRLGHLEGMAAHYVSLGLIGRTRGDLARARQYGEKALALFQKIGPKEMARDIQTWIDDLPKDSR